MNYRWGFDPTTVACSITKTGAALGPNVVGSLKMARVVLEDRVTKHIAAAKESMKAAVKVREEKLPSEPAPAEDVPDAAQ